jgi:Dolichyl-phosphate-mannose-protein mannosyltransferase
MPRPSHGFSVAAFLVLAAAAVLRLAASGHGPPGLAFEEVSLAAQALHPAAPLTPGPGSQAITYVMAGSLALFGSNLLGIRLASVACGLLTIVLTTRWIGLLYGRRVALIAAALLAVSFWPLYFSRIGLEAALLPPLVALVNGLYARALARASRKIGVLWFGLAGLAMGLALYTPPGGWLIPVVFASLYGYLLLARREILRASPMGHAAFWGAAILAGAPLILAQRGVNISPQTQALAEMVAKGDIGPLWAAIDRAGGMWTTLGDGLFHYNVGHWPVFNVGLATVFMIGLLYPAYDHGSRSRDAADPRPTLIAGRILIPLWLVAGVVASVMTDPERPFTMGIVALPATYIVLALGFDLIGRLAASSPHLAPLARHWAAVVTLILIGVAAEGAWSYFVVGPADPLAQGDYRSDLFVLAHDLRSSDGGGVAIGTAAPHNVPPLIFEFLPHGDRPIHWFDPSAGLVIPASPGGAPAQVDVPQAVMVQPRLERYLGQPTPLAYGLRRYTIPAGDAFLAAFPPPSSQKGWVADAVAFPPDDPGGLRREVSLPVSFGDGVALLGYQSDTTRLAGKSIRVTLFWRVTRDTNPPVELSMFAHLLTADGALAAQTDALAVPSSTWRAGDIFIEIQDIPTDAALAAGRYHLQIGLYRRADGVRLPVLIGGAPAGDRLLLEPVEIRAP